MSILKKCLRPLLLTALEELVQQTCTFRPGLAACSRLPNHKDAKVTQTYIDSSQIKNAEEIIPPELDFERLHRKPQSTEQFL